MIGTAQVFSTEVAPPAKSPGSNVSVLSTAVKSTPAMAELPEALHLMATFSMIGATAVSVIA